MVKEKKELKQTPRSFVQTIALLHTVFFVSIVGFSLFAYFTSTSAAIDLESTDDPFFIAIPIVVLAGLVGGKFLFAKLIGKLQSEKSLKAKLAGYQKTSIMYYAFFEGTALFSIVGFLMTGNLYFLIIAAVIAAYLFLQRPTHSKVSEDLALSGKLKSRFDAQDEPILS